MSFNNEDLPLDYGVFLGAIQYLMQKIEADPPQGPRSIPKEMQLFVQKGHPSRHEVQKNAAWLLKMTQRCCFSLTSFLGSVIYIDRLVKEGKLKLYESTWRSTWVAMAVISEKRWEDNYIHPGHIHNTYNSRHTAAEQTKMQMALCKELDWWLAIELDEFEHWINKLRNFGNKAELGIHFQKVFIQRPIPNLKTGGRKTENTPSTAADTGDERAPSSDSQRQRRGSQHDLKQSVSQKQYDFPRANDPYQSHHAGFFPNSQQPGFTVTPRAPCHNDTALRRMMQHGAATCRREYHAQNSTSQLTCDWAPQHAPDLRPGAGRQGTDCNHLDLHLTDLRSTRMQDLGQFRASYHNNGVNADYHLLGVSQYQQRHRLAAQHRHSAMGATAYDHGAVSSWTSRAPQYDAPYQRSSVVAWAS
jgi:hypothetical protein